MQKEQPITLPDILQEQKASQYSRGIYTRGLSSKMCKF